LLLDTYEPDPEINVFKFRNMGTGPVTGVIEAAGTINEVQFEGQGRAEAQDNILQVRAVGDRAVLRFTTRPYNAALKIKFNYRGEPVPVDRLLVSNYALPLLENRAGASGGADLYLLKGTADYEDNSGAFRVYWGRLAQYKLEWEKQAGVSGVFKEMLAEWGYLSEPQKK
jgi:hypothetical protein